MIQSILRWFACQESVAYLERKNLLPHTTNQIWCVSAEKGVRRTVSSWKWKNKWNKTEKSFKTSLQSTNRLRFCAKMMFQTTSKSTRCEWREMEVYSCSELINSKRNWIDKICCTCTLSRMAKDHSVFWIYRSNICYLWCMRSSREQNNTN